MTNETNKQMTKDPSENRHTGVSYFEIGEHNIKVVASFATGLEEVYLNDKLVSKARNWWFKSVHRFTIDGAPAEVIIRMINLIKGPVTIALHVDGQYKDGDEWDLTRIMSQLTGSKKHTWWVVMLIIFGCGLLGGAVGYTVGALMKG